MPIIGEEAVIQSTSICILKGTLIVFIIYKSRKTLHQHRHTGTRRWVIMQHVDDNIRHHKRRKEGDTSKVMTRYKEPQEKYDKHDEVLLYKHRKQWNE